MNKHEFVTRYLRNRECLSCGHEWVAPVVMSDHTMNLSGEARVWCPECSSATVMSSPATEVKADGTEQEQE